MKAVSKYLIITHDVLYLFLHEWRSFLFMPQNLTIHAHAFFANVKNGNYAYSYLKYQCQLYANEITAEFACK